MEERSPLGALGWVKLAGAITNVAEGNDRRDVMDKRSPLGALGWVKLAGHITNVAEGNDP